ncbi:S1C family serine protease, partial [Elusimicrobiota bacterium]
IEHNRYTHSKAYLLTCQIDAAINSGNSGGPVLKNDKIVGVAFQSGRGENIGYMVPSPVIKHFLNDIKDDNYDGIPGLGISWQNMENPDLRNFFKMKNDHTGVLITKIYPSSPASEQFQKFDIILSLDGINVNNDGTIQFRKDDRAFFGFPIQQKQINDSCEFEILRDGRIIQKKIELSSTINSWRLVVHNQYDILPTYYITGGLVFTPLTFNFLSEWGGDWKNAPLNLSNYYLHGEPSIERTQIVILLKVLADEINIGYHDWNNIVVSRVNDKIIRDMKSLVTALESNTGEFHKIEFENGKTLILGTQKSSDKSILKKYMIQSGRSDNI